MDWNANEKNGLSSMWNVCTGHLTERKCDEDDELNAHDAFV